MLCYICFTLFVSTRESGTQNNVGDKAASRLKETGTTHKDTGSAIKDSSDTVKKVDSKLPGAASSQVMDVAGWLAG